MEKIKSQKVLSWSTKDVVLTVLNYVVNAIIIAVLFLLAVKNNDKRLGVDTFSAVTFVHFSLLLFLVVGIIALYFVFEDKDFLRNQKNSEMIFLILELSLIICYVVGVYLDIYLRPLALAAILTLFLTNRRTAIFINFIFCVLIFMFDYFGDASLDLTNDPVLIMGFTSGVMATFCLDKVHARFKLLYTSMLLSVPIILCSAMTVIEHGAKDAVPQIVGGVFSGPFAAAIFMILLPIFEFLFKKVSYFKYSELTDHKAPLIRKLIKNAPGTFNHSIVVSNIAEACAAAIGEDSLLARTCAYYHDIGKLRRPEFFKENQVDADNPHDDLTPELSANIIKSHAQDGEALAEKHRLPREIADVCKEHHGTLPILYFYDKAKKFTDGEVDIMQFCYPGPKPKSKIAAILMIADGCEAAARSLQDRSRENVKKVVRNIVNERMALGQFEDCEITLKELNIIIHTVVNNLTGIYHSRIEYPKVNLDGVEL